MSEQPTEKQDTSLQQGLSYIAEPLRPLAVPCDSLILDPANARKHGEANVEAIKGSLATYGQRKPIVARSDTRTVIAGNGTLQAARELRWSHLAVVFTDDDSMTAVGFAIADNRTAELAEWDGDALDRLLGEVRVEDVRLQEMFDELAEAEGSLARAVQEPVPPEDFAEVGDDIQTEHCCPKCGYRWSGESA